MKKSHSHNPGNEGAKPHEKGQPRNRAWKPHRDWRVWAALLLIALVMGYVLTDSEALQPGEPASQPMPAMGGP
jgi:hypothetical protein